MKYEDHSWARIYWEDIATCDGQNADPQNSGEKRAICKICRASGRETIRVYDTANHRSKAWQHTVKHHGMNKPRGWGTQVNLIFGAETKYPNLMGGF